MLCTSGVPVQQIAQAVGITDPFILVEFSRSELAFRLLNIVRSSSIIHTNINRVHSYLKITVLYLWRVKGNIGLKVLSLKSLLCTI